MAEDIETIARRLSTASRGAWANAQWEGEYFSPPDLPNNSAFIASKAMGLLAISEGDLVVTSLGEHLITHLQSQRLSWWKRLFAHLQENPK